MISHYISSIQGIDLFGIISTVIAVAGFIWSVLWALRRTKKYLNHMAELPLEAEFPQGNATVQETFNKVEL
jgi:hypothetical protein